MHVSLAQMAADDFVGGIQNDPHTELGRELGKKFVEEIYKDRNGLLRMRYVSDWLHLWLLSGLGHRACGGDPLTYLNAVALVYVEFATNRSLFGDDVEAVPAMPETLVTETMSDEATFVSSPEFLIPVALTPTGFELTRLSGKSARRAAVSAFIEHPEWHRYGFRSFSYFPPHDTAK